MDTQTILVPLISVVLHLAAVVWSLVLVYRFRDARLVMLAAILGLATLQPVLTARGSEELVAAVSQATDLAMIVLSLVVLAYLGRVFTWNVQLREAIRAQQEAEKARRASELKFTTAFLSSPNVLLLNTHPEGRILEVNDTFVELSGYRREEVIGRTTRELNLWGELKDREKMIEMVREHGQIRGVEFEYRVKSGDLHPGILSTALIEIDGSTCLLSTMEDMTELKRVADEREAVIRELERKNAELERFTYTVSHDLKSPLVTIRGFLGLVERDVARGDFGRLAGDINKIRLASETMCRLLDDLLEVSRIGRLANPSEDIDLAELAHEAVELVRGQIERRGADVRIAEDLPSVWGDRPRLLEVMQNLIDNAIKFMGDEPRPTVDVGARREGEDTVCYVRDNGIGIDPRYLETVFGLFDRLDTAVEGTGVGLALVKRIVELHGGRVWAESTGMGSGSTFFFALPRSPGVP